MILIIFCVLILILIYLIYSYDKNCKSQIYVAKLENIQKEIKLCDDNNKFECMKNIFYNYGEENLWNDISKECNICNLE